MYTKFSFYTRWHRILKERVGLAAENKVTFLAKVSLWPEIRIRSHSSGISRVWQESGGTGEGHGQFCCGFLSLRAVSCQPDVQSASVLSLGHLQQLPGSLTSEQERRTVLIGGSE